MSGIESTAARPECDALVREVCGVIDSYRGDLSPREILAMLSRLVGRQLPIALDCDDRGSDEPGLLELVVTEYVAFGAAEMSPGFAALRGRAN